MSDYKAMLAAVREEEVEELSMMASYIMEGHLSSYYGRRQKEYMLEHFCSVDAISKEIEDGDLYFWIDSIPSDEKESVLGMLDVCGYLSCVMEEGAILIKNIYIMEEIRGRHLIRECMELLKQEENLKDAESIKIRIPEGYVQALKVFEHIGFTRNGKVDVPVGDKYHLHCFELEMK